LPNWEEEQQNERQPNNSGHEGSSFPDEDTTDDELPEDDGDDTEPDPFINLLNSNGAAVDENKNVNKDGGRGLKRPRNAKNQRTKLNPLFCEASIVGVEACTDPNEVSRIQTLVQLICGWKG